MNSLFCREMKGENINMKDKMLNTFSVESNGETIKVDILKNDKGILIKIDGKTMDVFINGEEFYSKYDKEEYKYIPTHLRNFVEENLCDYGDGIRKDKSEINCDLILEGKEYFMVIPTKRSNKNYFLLRDWLIDYQMLADDGKEMNLDKEKIKYEEFLSNIKSHGYEMKFSHGGNDYDNWFDLVINININNFDFERIKTCINLWQDYNQYLTNTYLNGRY